MNSRRNPPSKPTTTGASPLQEHGYVTPSRAATPHVNPGVRKKATGIRQWLLVDSTGQGQVVEAGKHTVMRRTGLPARDLRILDPMLSYPSTVLGRERAIVINLEHIKAIITAYEVLLLNSTDPFVVTFVEELQRRIIRYYHATAASQAGTTNSDDKDWTHLYDLGEPKPEAVTSPSVSTTSREKHEEVKQNGLHSLDSRGVRLIRFEFVALEGCIEAACSSLDKAVATMNSRRNPPSKPTTTGASPLQEHGYVTPSRAATPHVNPGVRKKATGIRQWLLVDSTGQGQVVEAGKHTVMRRTGLPARDLRILDPMLSYPSTVLGRERAIVINLEHIKAIITAYEVLLLNSTDPFVVMFVEELQRRIMRYYHATTASQAGTANSDDKDWTHLYDLGEPKPEGVTPPSVSTTSREKNEEVKPNGLHSLDSRGVRLIRFEFVALEGCIEAACSSLDKEARTLETEAHPALDKLTTKISTLNLERVRQIKSRLVAISGHVQKVRDELEHLLDDDGDMAEMYLTDKLMQQLENASGTSSVDEQEDVDEHVLRSEADDRNYRYILLNYIRVPMEANESVNEVNLKKMDSQRERFLRSNTLGRESRITRNTTIKHRDIEELEMLLEAYFVQIDGTLNKLSTDQDEFDLEEFLNGDETQKTPLSNNDSPSIENFDVFTNFKESGHGIEMDIGEGHHEINSMDVIQPRMDEENALDLPIQPSFRETGIRLHHSNPYTLQLTCKIGKL
ncbi:magnesium transporter MRS2-D [Artemisia annua]|uniref:Magnesium transporter MRS2-D n=1 Tax=Artemisia annua TaxID=35608 RepID=A0A2U1LTB5_ARTAN|nr:magnesium transporter MRS2-D [Artemisia annua]